MWDTSYKYLEYRDCEEDQKTLPVMAAPAIDMYLTVRPQIVLFHQNYLDELGSISTHIADTIYAAQNFHNPSVTVSTLHVYDTSTIYQDQQLQEFLDGEECCRNFINQDLTFLQHSHNSNLLRIRYVEYSISNTLEISLQAMVQGFCKFKSINILLASNILDSSMLSKVTIVLH